jgi:hypothetical protein
MVAGTCLGSGYLGIFDERVHVRKDWSHPYPDFSLAFASCFPGNSVSNTSPDSQVGPFYRIFHPQPLNPAWDPGWAKWHPARLGPGRHCIGVRIRSTRRVSPVVCPGPYPCRFRRAPRYGRWDRRASNSRSGSSLGPRARTTAGTSLETNRGRGAIGLSSGHHLPTPCAAAPSLAPSRRRYRRISGRACFDSAEHARWREAIAKR